MLAVVENALYDQLVIQRAFRRPLTIVPERPAGVADAPTAERVVVLCAAEGPLWEGGSTGRPV